MTKAPRARLSSNGPSLVHGFARTIIKLFQVDSASETKCYVAVVSPRFKFAGIPLYIDAVYYHGDRQTEVNSDNDRSLNH